MTRDESKPARTSHGQPVTQYQYARLLDAAARLAGEVERAEAENERLRALLERMDRRGGLGLDVHAWIRAALAGEKAPAEAPNNTTGAADPLRPGNVRGSALAPLPAPPAEAPDDDFACPRNLCCPDPSLCLYPGECVTAPAEAPPCMCSLKANPSTWRLCPLHDPPAEAPAGERCLAYIKGYRCTLLDGHAEQHRFDAPYGA